MLKVLEIALGETGYHEGAGNVNRYAEFLDGLDGFYNGKKNGYAWCDIFVDYCFVKAYGRKLAEKLLCQPDFSAGAGCTYSARYYQQAGRWSEQPQVGAQIFFGSAAESCHTGLVYALDENTVYTVEGNTSDMVARREYPRDFSGIYGYGIPNFGLVNEEMSETKTAGDAETAAGEADYSGVYGETEDDEIVYYTKTSPAATPRNCTVTLPELQEGAKGESVRAMQTLLIAGHFACGGEGPDGDLGKATLQGLKNFQSENGLDADGICGAMTWAKLIGGIE